MKSLHRPGHRLVSALAVSGLAAMAVGSITAEAKGTAAAHAATPAAGKANTPANQQDVTTPAKYQIVNSGPLTNPARTESFGSVGCPVVSGVQTRPTGGGVFMESRSVGANVKSSIASGKNWEASVDNSTGSATSFTVYAICGKPKLTYHVVSTSITVPADTETSGTVFCPAGQQVVGGGVFVSSSDLAANVNESNPASPNGWVGYVNNGSSASTSASVQAICEKYPFTAGYSVVESNPATVNPGTQAFVAALCPIVNGIQTSVLSGGESNTSTSLAFNINSIFPASTTSYGTWVDNGSGSAETFSSWAFCAFK